MWSKVLAISVVEKIALDELLYGKILPHLRSIQTNVHEAIIRTERVIASLNDVWTGSSVTEDRRYGFFVIVFHKFILFALQLILDDILGDNYFHALNSSVSFHGCML